MATNRWATADDAFQRQFKESSAANQALIDYAQMGKERSLRKLAARYLQQRDQQQQAGEPANVPTVRVETLEDWSRKYHWQDRVAVFDDEQRAARLRARRADIDTMNIRHVQLSHGLLAKAADWLKEKTNKVTKASDVAAYVKLAVEIERRALGLPTEHLELTAMSTDALLTRYYNLVDQIRLQAVDGGEEDGEDGQGTEPATT